MLYSPHHMLPFHVNGIWLSGSEGGRQFCEICSELCLSHSCFNSSGGGRGNSSMYVHSLLQTWHGRRNNVLQLSEWLPEQSIYSAAAPQLPHCSPEGPWLFAEPSEQEFCVTESSYEFTCLWRRVFKRLRQQLEEEAEGTTPESNKTCFSSQSAHFPSLLKRLTGDLAFITSELAPMRKLKNETLQTCKVIIIIMPDWYHSAFPMHIKCSGPLLEKRGPERPASVLPAALAAGCSMWTAHLSLGA